MSEANKTYRIRTKVGSDVTNEYISLDANLVQDYEAFDILSVKISSADTYKLHNANYGVVVGRVLANNGFGIPNAKISIFIESDSEDGEYIKELYPFINSFSKNDNGVRYNLLPDESVSDCHQIVGTFPNKRYLLDNDIMLEVFDKYYTFTTRTNNSGDYLIMGIPTGTHTLHMDLDLSDCGILSQKPRDFVYKGYTVEQFENPNKFKGRTEYENLSQVFSQDRVINVQPFWGNESLGETIGLTRADINVSFDFQPTCVFIGSVISDKSSDGITKKCMATENMGNMEEMTTGEGTIEMIRKTPSGAIEEFQVKGTQLIDANGVWCYQIPMNLDYMMTDEYGNMVPTDDPNKGIPTRCSVRFRISMQDNEENLDNFFRAKVLVPHNPQNLSGGTHEEYDYEFGSKTRDDSFRDLFWNNVYSVKSYIPRFQKRKARGWKDKRFTGIKSCNFAGSNNPLPYNNIRIKLPLMFTILCAIIKCLIFLTGIFNTLVCALGNFLANLGRRRKIIGSLFKFAYESALELKLNVLSEGLCPDLENWFFAPLLAGDLTKYYRPPKGMNEYDLLTQTLAHLTSDTAYDDEKSIEYNNRESEDEVMCLTTNVDYLISCVEMNLAMEYKVINFDFYNDWINGTIYIPRFMRYLRPKKTFLGITFAKAKIKGCMDDTKIYSTTRRYTQQCALEYASRQVDGSILYTNVANPLGGSKNRNAIRKANNFHKKPGFSQLKIFGDNGGVCHEHITSKKHNVYYMKPCEWTLDTTPSNIKVNLFATDIILLGSLNDCDSNGLPQAFKYLSSTSYIMPTNLALTNMETNGPLYANQKNTICTGNGGQMISDSNINKEGGDGAIQVIPVSNGLSGEIKYYRDANDENIDTTYDGQELSDIIALTESAGISWNYTGPGQGEINEKMLYYPGGHFLGLTCVNSQTNIKSCINLERICEVGASMSQRKEEIKGIDNNGIASYVYYAPTGFISGNDIVGDDFRVMFSTLNHKRLIANKINPLTGYKMYDFNYIHPTNFDGSFSNVIRGSKLYNTKVSVPNEDKPILKRSGIEIDGSKRPDYDINENNNTYTRTIEDSSIDYYRFRFGLDKENLRKKSNLQERKFLSNKNNKYLLPQYENSFYFYFGMRPGSSAIDEFNKQFFSQCETNAINMSEPDFNVSVTDINICEGIATVLLSIENLETPYSKIYYSKEGDVTQISGNTTPDINDDVYELNIEVVSEDFYNLQLIEISGLSFGNYTFTIMDANGLSFNKTISVGNDIFSLDVKKHDFNVSENKTLNNTVDIFKGGYFEFDNFKINEKYINDLTEAEIKIEVKLPNGTYKEIDARNSNKLISVPDANDIYDIYISYQCKDSNKSNRIYNSSYLMLDGSSLTLNMGFKNPEFYLPIKNDENNILKYGVNNFNSTTTNPSAVAEWVKAISIFKRSTSADTFSNNVFAIGGDKILWGVPQSSENGYYKEENGGYVIISSEDDSSEFNNYTLDDDYSYLETPASLNYSAIAINGTTVSGDYYAKLDNGTILFLDKNKFIDNTGYVFKPLPDGDLQFHVYNGELKYDKYIDSNGEVLNSCANEKEFEDNGGTIIKNGIFYPSFNYPVIESLFNAEANFYVWNKKSLDVLEGSDEANFTNETVGARTEIRINGGITYDNKFSTLDISNINSDNFEQNRWISGMTVTVYNEETDEEEKINAFEETKIGGSTVTIVKGVENITDLYFQVTEGAPDKNSVNDGVVYGDTFDMEYLKNSVNTLSESFSVDPFESEYTYSKYGNYYEIYDRYGKSLSFKNEDEIFSENSNKKIYPCCCDCNLSNSFIVQPDNNSKYIYVRLGGDKRPLYYVLCTYNNNVSKYESVDNTETIIGEYVIMKIDYNGNRKFYVDIPYINTDGDLVNQHYQSTKNGDFKKNRNNLEFLINHVMALKTGNFEKGSIATPVYNKTINIYPKNNNSIIRWSNAITNDNKKIELFGDKLISLGGNLNTLYIVEKDELSSNDDSISRLYKVVPMILPKKENNNGITIEFGGITGNILNINNNSDNTFSVTFKWNGYDEENPDKNLEVPKFYVNEKNDTNNSGKELPEEKIGQLLEFTNFNLNIDSITSGNVGTATSALPYSEKTYHFRIVKKSDNLNKSFFDLLRFYSEDSLGNRSEKTLALSHELQISIPSPIKLRITWRLDTDDINANIMGSFSFEVYERTTNIKISDGIEATMINKLGTVTECYLTPTRYYKGNDLTFKITCGNYNRPIKIVNRDSVSEEYSVNTEHIIDDIVSFFDIQNYGENGATGGITIILTE